MSSTTTIEGVVYTIITGTGPFATTNWTGAGSPTNFMISGFTSVANNAFQGKFTITNVHIGNTVLSIGENAFNNSGVISVSFESSSQLATIGDHAFNRAISLTSIAIPDGVTGINEFTFFSTTSLTSVTFGENSLLTSIGETAFQSTLVLTTIVIPNSVTSIEKSAFRNAVKLASITIPDSVNLGQNSFDDISTNPTVYVVDVSPVTFDEFKDKFNASTNRTITYVEYDPLYYFNDTAIDAHSSGELYKSDFSSDTNDDFILRSKEELKKYIEKVAFVLKWTDNDRTIIESANFKSSINSTYYKPNTTKGQQIYVLEDNKDSVNTILVADENWPQDNGPILYWVI